MPLCRGDGYCCHWLGVLALCDVGALATVVGSLLNPRKAVANADHEFGLELCKRAGSVIYDPRLCAMAGECYELKVSSQ